MSPVLSLNGLWDFVVDLDPKYHFARSYAHPDWDRRHWLKVPVPGVWNKYAERYDLFEGIGWFARKFTLPKLAAGTTGLLRFGAVNYSCEVFVNGMLAGTHEGGYTEFSFDISHLVFGGTNSIAVRVDNRSQDMRLPPVLGYFNYGGIHRDVTIELYPDAYLHDLNADAVPGNDRSRLRLFGQVARAAPGCRVKASCGGHVGQVEVGSDGSFQLELENLNTQPWSPDHPILYPVSIEVSRNNQVCQLREIKIGFRTLSTRGSRIELNGNALDFRGICYVYDSPAYGLEVRPEQYESDLELLRELGVNAIRSHFPFPHSFLAACDRAGILIWIEPPVYCIDPAFEICRDAFVNPAWRTLALNMLTEMIEQSKLHTSVGLYGIGNECHLDSPGAMDFFRSLANRARTLDPTRLVSYAALYGRVGEMSSLVDVIGLNEYWGWYDVLFPSNAASDPAIAGGVPDSEKAIGIPSQPAP